MAGNEVLYNAIGKNYNATRQADPYLANRILQLLNPSPAHHYLDIGCGTGNYTIWFAEKGYDFYGIDPSAKMLDEARGKFPALNWIIGNAENIPAENIFFNGVIATLTIHHWQDLPLAFTELFRVMAPGYRVVIFTSTPEQMQGYWLNHYFPAMMLDSIRNMPSLQTVADAAIRAGFRITTTEQYDVQPDLQDKFLFVGKHDPHLYFSEGIRQGISSFAALANREEVAHGLNLLRRDIESGEFEHIRNNYKNTRGDYLFIVLEK